MTVAHDAATETSSWTTTPDPFTFSHTPVGTPAGVIIFVITSGSASDIVTTITYGGVGMSDLGFIGSSAAEPVGSTAWFLGSGIPTGAQTVSIDHTAGATVKYAVAVTVTAAANTEVLVTGTVGASTSNPQVALDTGAASALRYAGLGSGLNAPSSATLLADMTAVHDLDLGAQSAIVGRQTTASSGSFTIGWTAAATDSALFAAAIQEVSGAATVDPYPYIGGGYYPTEG